ncbi:alcohol dehydrogenase catalytic domain-containing protein [Leucobacter sp. GX0328]
MPTMKAAVLTQTSAPLEFLDIERPQPGPGQVLVKIEACGVCHSDVHYWNGEDELPEGRPQPVLGHEGVGTIVELGEGARGEIGDRVGIGFVYETCGECRECRTGGETYCQNSQATGVHVDGCFAEYIVSADNWVTPIDERLDSAEAAPLLCAGVTAFSAVSKTGLGPGKIGVVFGLGGVGMYALQFAVLTGAKVIALDFDEAKLEQAREYGAALALKPGDEATAEILALGGADACLSFAPSPKVLKNEIEVAAPRATIVQVALPPQELSFYAWEIINKGLRIVGSADGTRLERDTVIRLAAEGRVQSKVLPIPFADINESIIELDEGRAPGRYVVTL